MLIYIGLVFLQYRSETKRALLPNEITSIDTVRALFVRSFPRQLTMAYLEGPNVKIYIHDASKDMFYELEDVRLVFSITTSGNRTFHSFFIWCVLFLYFFSVVVVVYLISFKCSLIFSCFFYVQMSIVV